MTLPKGPCIRCKLPFKREDSIILDQVDGGHPIPYHAECYAEAFPDMQVNMPVGAPLAASLARAKAHGILQFFVYAHLPEHVQGLSAAFGELAFHLVDTLPDNDERTVALRKLLEAKDAAVRARLWKDAEATP